MTMLTPEASPVQHRLRPQFMYHGTDAMTAAIATRNGFSATPPDYIVRTRFAEPGWLHGTPELEWARAYARARAKRYRMLGAVVRIDLKGLAPEDDPTVALDGLAAPAYRIRTPIPPTRVTLTEELRP